jgi:hypothetical protein
VTVVTAPPRDALAAWFHRVDREGAPEFADRPLDVDNVSAGDGSQCT